MRSTRGHGPCLFLILGLVVLAGLISAGCAGPHQSRQDIVSPAPGSGVPDARSWKEYPLLDHSGKGNFSIHMFTGTPVLVSVQSVSCPSCIVLLRRQLDEIDRFLKLHNGKIVVVSLNLDPAGDADGITSYAGHFNFSGYAASSPTGLTLDLYQALGPFAVDTDTAPVILVCPDGHDLLLPPGLKTAETLNATLAEAC